MSASPHDTTHNAGDGAKHDLGHDAGHAESTFGGYMTGFVLSVILTAAPFWLVMSGALHNPVATAGVVMALAVAQIVVHMVFFLHMDARSEGGWTILALIFTLVLVGIALSGSLWVMYHLNTNMMPMSSSPSSAPMSPQDMRNMP